MNATRIIAIRHGETDWNVQTRIQGHMDIDLNEKGRWQASRLASSLAHEDLSQVYCSDLSRAKVTAQSFALSLDIPVQEDRELRERHFGIFEGLTWRELEETHPDEARQWKSRDPHWVPPQGESLEMLRLRVVTSIHRLAAKHLGEQIAIVTHGGVLDILYRVATHQFDQSPRTWSLGNTFINRLLWSNEGLHLVGWGDNAHLEHAPQAEPSKALF